MPQACRAASFACSIRNPFEGNGARLHIKSSALEFERQKYDCARRTGETPAKSKTDT